MDNSSLKIELRNHAYVVSQSTCAFIEALGMMTENNHMAQVGEFPTYKKEDFIKLINRYGIHHNAVVGTHRG